MGTNKPRVQTILEPDIYAKFKELCKTERRTESNFAGNIITDYIINYESEHGTIELPQEPERE